MKIILIQNVKNIGQIGDIKDVADGYATNFLFPKKLAQAANADSIEKVKKIKDEQLQKEEEVFEKIKKLAAEMKDRELLIRAKEKNGKLFGSVGEKDIVKELKKQGVDVREDMIILKEPIKMVGEKDIKIKLAEGIETKIRLIIEGE
jgi:large subunit ribosomal protein L9